MTMAVGGVDVAIPLSIIVISNGRSERLALCLKALTLQDHPQIEIMVVADAPGLAAAGQVLGADFRAVPHDVPGVAAARNAGLVQAAFGVVAFIDDDAVAEPTWASRLAAPFADPAVIAATGPVRGRRGIAAEWSGSIMDSLTAERPLGAPEGRTSFHASVPGSVVVTIGTNCAFRRDVVLAQGGFDPAFRYYLDESDLNARLTGGGGLTAFVPGAVVHHRPAANAVRRGDRTVTSLFDIGRSTAIYLRRHAAADQIAAAWQAVALRQRQRLLRQMVAGWLLPDQLAGVMATLKAGFDDGCGLPMAELPRLTGEVSVPVILPGTGMRPGAFLVGRLWQRRSLRRKARALAESGQIVTVLILSPTVLPHRVGFVEGGWWEQHGGLFRSTESLGRSRRFCGFSKRAIEERARTAATRSV